MNEEKKVDASKLSDFEVSILVIERDVAQFKAARIDELLNEIGEAKGCNEAEERIWNPSGIAWKEAEGAKGKYERYPAEGEKAESTTDYKNMLADLKEHNGKLTRDGLFYWVFTDQATVGRKKTK